MRLLITGGAGFVGGNLAVSLAARHPDWEIVALDNLMRRGSELNLPRLREAGVEFVHGDVREPADLAAAGRLRRDGRVLGRAVGPGRLRRHLLLGPDQPDRRLQLPRAGAPRRGLRRLPLDQPRLPGRAAARARASRRRRPASSWPPSSRSPAPGPAGISEELPAGRRAHALRRHQARGRAADRGVRRRLRPARGDRPLRRDRRALADGQGRPGRLLLVAARATTSASRSPTSASAAPASRCATCSTSRTWSTWSTSSSATPSAWSGVTVNVGGGRECSLSLLETTEICRELTGNEVPIEVVPETRPGDVPIYLTDCARLVP